MMLNTIFRPLLRFQKKPHMETSMSMYFLYPKVQILRFLGFEINFFIAMSSAIPAVKYYVRYLFSPTSLYTNLDIKNWNF